MLPKLEHNQLVSDDVYAFIQELQACGFAGDATLDYADRLAVATDNSIYQLLPQAVVFPKSTDDVSLLCWLLDKECYHKVTLCPRGGGTGTNGQSLTHGVIVDFSRHMDAILDLNLEEGWVHVQAGVVLDQLNAYLKQHGVFFAPSLSPSNRATLGGMVATDASGQGSRIYGKTSEHIHSLLLVFKDGTTHESLKMTERELDGLIKRKDIVGRAYEVVVDICKAKQALIRQTFPPLNRFLTGYNLDKVYDGEGNIDVNILISGSEGTLALVPEMKLKLTPIPKEKCLILIQYNHFDHALSHVKDLLELEPLAIETMDDKIIHLAKNDIIWNDIKQQFGTVSLDLKAINYVELIAEDTQALDKIINRYRKMLKGELSREQRPVLGYRIEKDAESIKSLWNVRKKAVGLLANTSGMRKPQPFVEDTVVPPDRLADYVKEFRAILDEYLVDYGMFGHVDVGCLHVRPVLDMTNTHDERLMRHISDRVCTLVLSYGGIMWGEHSKGLRAEYIPQFFGEELTHDMRLIKEAFDPYNQLNPGKIVSPASMQEGVTKIDEAPLRGHFDRKVSLKTRQRFMNAFECNGNGLCVNVTASDVMCPSSKVTRDKLHSPKGRAAMMREWFRLLSDKHYNVNALPKTNFITKLKRAFLNRRSEYDFSHEVYETMHGCLSCKACASQCPVHVDIPHLKSHFLEHYHTRYFRPVRDYAIANLERYASVASRMPNLVNAVNQNGLVKLFFRKILKLVDVPRLSSQSALKILRQKGARVLKDIALLNEANKPPVVLVQDAFTSFFDAKVVVACHRLLDALGYEVFVLPFQPSGKPAHVKGFLKHFRAIAQKNSVLLNQIAQKNVPMIGLEPSVTLAFRQEYEKELGSDVCHYQVHLLQEWLCDELKNHPKGIKSGIENDSLPHKTFLWLGHCTERTSIPDAFTQWQNIFKAFGITLITKPVGCCGMAGAFGHEAEHEDESKGIYDLSWREIVEKNEYPIIATGYSCRCQIQRLSGQDVMHPVEALAGGDIRTANVSSSMLGKISDFRYL